MCFFPPLTLSLVKVKVLPGSEKHKFRVSGEGWCWDMVSGQATRLFALGHAILGCSAESICWAPKSLRGPPLLGLLQKAQLESVGRVCQRLENEPSQSPQGSERERTRTRLQSRLPEEDCVLCDTVVGERRGDVGSRAWMPRLNNSWVVNCYLLVVQSLSACFLSCTMLTLAFC